MEEIDAPAHGRGKVTFRAVLRGLAVELGELREAIRLTPVWLWLRFGVVALALSCLGLLPLGAWTLPVQALSFALIACVVVWPESVARVLRSSDAFGVRERDSSRVATYLPVAVAVFGLPFYLCAQAVLFWRVMQLLPGVLSGSSLIDAWRYAVDSLLFTELFLDLFDVFGIGLAADPPGFAGRSLVFVTRLLLSIGFVRIALALARAAFYRAHGLGRGEDSITQLERAASSGDAVLAGHLGRELTKDVNTTVEMLLARRVAGVATTADTRSLRALREWAIPYLRTRITHGDPRGEALDATSRELADAWEQEQEAPARLRYWRIAVAAVALTAIVAMVGFGPAPWAFAVGVVTMLLLAWLLVSPRASFEAAMEAGVAPFLSIDRLRGGVLAWAALLAAAFLLASWGTLSAAAFAWPGTFGPSDAQADRSAVLGFIGSSMLRIQLFLSVPEVFRLGEAGIEQRPVLGSVLTFILRTGLNLGAAAVVVTALSIRRDREGLSGLLGAPDSLALRMEALRGGRHAHLLVTFYDIRVCGRLWRALDAAKDSDTQDAMAVSGAFDWCVMSDSLGESTSVDRLTSQAAVIQALHARGWVEQAETWTSQLASEIGDGEWPAAARAQVLARFAAIAAHEGSYEDATTLFSVAYEALLEDRDDPDASPVASLEAQGVWVRAVTRALGVLPPEALEVLDISTLADRASEIAAALVESRPQRFITDALRLGGLRAALIGRTTSARAGIAELERVVEATLTMPRQHPWRGVLVLNLVGTASALGAMAKEAGEPHALETAVRLESTLLGELGALETGWDATELAVRAYDERLGEELAQSVGILAGLTPTNAAYVTAMRAADVFEARLAAGVFEARGYAVGMRMFAAVTAFHLRAWSDSVAAAQRVFELSQGMRPSPPDQLLLANSHAFHAQASKHLGDEDAAREHATVARSLYEQLATSGWDEAEDAIAEGRTYLQGL